MADDRPSKRPSTPEAALDELRAGNRRFMTERAEHPGVDRARIKATAEGQAPYVSILACADSRAPIELIFDQGVGDLFVVRVAGNVCGRQTVGSLEFGTVVLGTPLLVVLGHTDCGAVKATIEGAPVPGHIGAVLEPIAPAVAQARREAETSSTPLIDLAVHANALLGVENLLTRSALIADRVRDRRLKVVAAVYDVSTGAVKMLGEHPEQDDLLG